MLTIEKQVYLSIEFAVNSDPADNQFKSENCAKLIKNGSVLVHPDNCWSESEEKIDIIYKWLYTFLKKLGGLRRA